MSYFISFNFRDCVYLNTIIISSKGNHKFEKFLFEVPNKWTKKELIQSGRSWTQIEGLFS